MTSALKLAECSRSSIAAARGSNENIKSTRCRCFNSDARLSASFMASDPVKAGSFAIEVA